jgi:hypothetical protein
MYRWLGIRASCMRGLDLVFVYADYIELLECARPSWRQPNSEGVSETALSDHT